jgi:signal transduction histidine kinase
MRSFPTLKLILCLLVVLTGYETGAQQPDTLKLRLSDLLVRYQRHSLRDMDYLKAVDSIAPLLEKEDSLPELLTTYRQLAFREPGRGKYRAGYYTYLAINAYNFSRPGSAIYYSEKNSEERIKTGQFEKGGFTHSDWFALTVYANNHNYPRVFAKYGALHPALQALPAVMDTGKISPDQVFVAVSILQTVNYAACRSGDTSRAREAIRLMKGILAAVGRSDTGRPGARRPDTDRLGAGRSGVRYKDYRLQYDYLVHSMYYEYYRLLRQFEPARDSLLAAIRDVLTPGFRPDLQTAYVESLYSEAVDLYFNRNLTDSARYYLSLLKALGDGKVRYSSLDPTFLPESNSRLLAGQGRYAEAYAQLRIVYQMLDSAYYTVSADKDNNLYALAEAENTRSELLRLEEKKRAAERSSITLFFVLTILVLGGIAGFMVYRSAQGRRLLDLRLQLARNFHDEIGPMLLYASILAKKEMGEANREGVGKVEKGYAEELKSQIGLIMDAVRDISHDLKSTRLGTIGVLGKEIAGVLEKVKAATDIDFSLQVGNGSRVLSHGQVTQLRAIVQELISNSIKHADCGKITVKVAAPGGLLTVYYSDDGKGIDPDNGRRIDPDNGKGIDPGSGVGENGGSPRGIGMKNIEERVAALKGSFQLHNSWPEGYFIDISIPLV